MIDKGKAVIVVRGRKVPIGTKGVVRWIGSNRWGTSVGLAVEGEEKLLFTAITNVEPDESPEALAREIDAAQDTALWIEARRTENAAAKAAAEAALPGVTLKKGDLVMPSTGAYVGRWCRVIWVGASRDGIRVGVVPKAGKPRFEGGRPVWPNLPADWLPLSAVAALPAVPAAA